MKVFFSEETIQESKILNQGYIFFTETSNYCCEICSNRSIKQGGGGGGERVCVCGGGGCYSLLSTVIMYYKLMV